MTITAADRCHLTSFMLTIIPYASLGLRYARRFKRQLCNLRPALNFNLSL